MATTWLTAPWSCAPVQPPVSLSLLPLFAVVGRQGGRSLLLRAMTPPGTPCRRPTPHVPPPGRAACAFYAAGCCRAGASCRFSHDAPAAASAAAVAAAVTADASSHAGGSGGGGGGGGSQVCAHYLMGSCRYGASCRRLHPPGVTLQGVGGTVGGGDGHGAAETGVAAAGGPHGGGEEAHEAARGGGFDSLAMASGPATGGAATASAECGICFDRPRGRGGRYGLLSGCDHPFCLDCVRQWRSADDGSESSSSSVHKTCPLCRVKSHYVIPSVSFLTGARKAAATASYREHVARIPCKYYTADGVCPFGVHCFYFHEAEAEESPRRRSCRGSRPGGGVRGRGRPGSSGRAHGHVVGTAGLDVDIDVDSSTYLGALPVPEDDASEDDNEYFTRFALEEILELLDISSSGRGLPSGY